MKNAKREHLMKKIAVAALMLGIYSPLAEAAISPKDGVSAEELSRIVTDLEILKDGNTIRFAGLMPKRCAESVIPLKAEYIDGKHIIKISMPACDNDYKPEATDEIVDAADYLNDVKLKDSDGEIVLRHYKNGSRNATDRLQDEVLTSLGLHKSQATVEEERIAKEQEETEKQIQAEEEAAAAARVARLEDLQASVVSYCKDGDFSGMGQEIEMAADVLEDVTGLLETVGESQKKALTKAVADAETAEDAKAAYDAFVGEATINGWDEDEAKEKYIEKRFEILELLAEDAKADDAKASDVDSELRAWARELRSFDRSEFRKQQGTFGKIYGDLGTHSANKGNVEQAVSFYDKAKPYIDAKGKMAMDGEAAKLYAKQFKDCLAKNPTKMEVCDQYADQAKARAQSIGDQLAQSGTEAEVQAYKAEYITTFGGGVSFNTPGIGSISPQQPGTLDNLKKQKYQEQAMQQQMQMQLQQQQCMAVGMNNPQAYQACMMQAQMTSQSAATPSSNFLGIK